MLAPQSETQYAVRPGTYQQSDDGRGRGGAQVTQPTQPGDGEGEENGRCRGDGNGGRAMIAAHFTLYAYAFTLGLLGLFGLHRLYLVALLVRTSVRTREVPLDDPAEWPVVTVQLPIFNELYVVGRLLDAVAALDYPRARLEVQVLDDSDDGTADAVAERVALLAGAELQVHHLRRSDREGFKAGALEAGLRVARGDLICVFDADFVPAPDFLKRAVVHLGDPKVGMVQARWSHLNRGRSLLTRIQAIFLDAHFAIEHAARNQAGRYFNFNGTAGVWRRAAIEDAGGWQHDTLTEDLDLSYRAQLAGWRFVYLNDLEAPAELPETVVAFKSQQRRWTRGAVQTARKLLPRIWRAPVPLSTKLEATFHLTSNLAYVLMVALALLVFPAMALRAQAIGTWVLWLEVPVLLFGTGSICVYFAIAQRAVGRSWLAAILRLPALMALGAGLALNNTVAAIRGLGGATGEFVRTPKTAAALATVPAARVQHYVSPLGWMPWVELALASYFLTVAVIAVQRGMWISLPVLTLFFGGYAYVSLLALGQAWRRRIATTRA